MNILHISDLHFDGSAKLTDTIIGKIVDSLKERNKHVDFILFTGDLVQSATVKGHYDVAKEKLFDYFCDTLQVPSMNVIFCPGNHDIDRSNKHPAVMPYFKQEINSSKDLSDFYKAKNKVYNDSLSTLANYQSFVKTYHTTDDDLFSDLYSIHYRSYNNETIAFVCIYTPWLSAIWDDTGELDDGNLCYPINALDEILELIKKKANRKVLLMHHPIGAMKKYLAFEIEDRIYNSFEMLFTGHVHKVMNVARHTGENGLFEHTAKATLTKGAAIGCTFIENLDYEPNKYLVSEITYVRDSNECHFSSEPVVVTIPVGQEKDEQIRLRTKVHERIEVEMQNANNLLLQKDESDENAFLTKFNAPNIKTQREDTANSYLTSPVLMSELYAAQSNFIIFGRDKCGKSSLLRRIQLEYLMNYTSYQRIPLYLDAKQECNKIDDKYDLEQILRNYLAVNTRQASAISQRDTLVLLVDNFRPDDAFCNYLIVFVKNHPNCVLFLATDDNVSNGILIDNLDFIKDGNFYKVFFHNLRRQEIIKYTDANLSNTENKEAVQEKIMKLCKQMELPFNYWTISLFLLIHHKSSDAYSKNLFAILDYCVDEIFDKKKFLVKEAQITFPQIKMVTASLASYLFKNHEATVYSAYDYEILQYLETEFKKNVRINAQPRMVFEFLNGCGMLKSQADGRYCFRLNGFFEYFLAYHMTRDASFKKEILSDEVKYLGFRNQLEIYSGLKNDDAETLILVFDKTVSKCKPLFTKYGVDKDAKLVEIVGIPRQLEEELKQISIQNALTPMEKAKIEDVAEGVPELRSDVHLMYRYDPTSTKIEVVERYLSILARVFKNIDNVDGQNVDIIEIFNSIIDFYCDFGYYIVENLAGEVKEELKKEGTSDFDDSDEMRLLKMMTYSSPILAQTFLYDGLGHYSLVRLLKMKIDELRSEKEANQYRLFILYFTLFDISLAENYRMIDQAIEDITKIPILRYMMFLKVNYYLAFKSYGNNQMSTFLQERAKKIKILLDYKTDVDKLQQALSDTKKAGLVTRNE